MALGENIRQILHDKWMSQAELARATGVDCTTISKLISGSRSNPSLEIVKKIANALDVTVDELISDKKEEV
jgi:transcriptional regulator with XRE-family HTH domain